MRIFVVGCSGQVAHCLREQGAARGLTLTTIGRPELDLETGHGLPDLINAFAPHVIINVAGYTAVDRAESEPNKALAINRDGTARLAALSELLKLPFLHLSTDYVYDGTKTTPYSEEDATGPTCMYGHSKLAGERAALGACSQAFVFRTGWVYSPFGHNFVKTMLRLARDRDFLQVVDDQIGNPTSAHDIADALLVIAALLAKRTATAPPAGVYHLAASGETTWCGFAREIMRLAAMRGHCAKPVTAIATGHFPTAARRPANSRLDGTKLAHTFGLSLPPWQTSLAVTIDRLCATPCVEAVTLGPEQ